jgi:hypothetical protein
MDYVAAVALNTSNIAEGVTPFLWAVFGLVILVWVMYSSVLLYHWVRYGYQSSSVMIASITYFVGSGLLIFISLVALLFV